MNYTKDKLKNNINRLIDDMVKEFGMTRQSPTDKNLYFGKYCVVQIYNEHEIQIYTDIKLIACLNKPYTTGSKTHTVMRNYDKFKGICFASLRKFFKRLPEYEKEYKNNIISQKIDEMCGDFNDTETI